MIERYSTDTLLCFAAVLGRFGLVESQKPASDLVERRGLEPLTPCLQPTICSNGGGALRRRNVRARPWLMTLNDERCQAVCQARAFVRIAGAERHPVRHLAPLAGVWGLAPTLPNVLELRSVAGSVPTGSHPYLPLVISQRTWSRRWWNRNPEPVECLETPVEDEEDDERDEAQHASAIQGLGLAPVVPDEPGDEAGPDDAGDREDDGEDAGDLVDGGGHGRQGIGMRAGRG